MTVVAVGENGILLAADWLFMQLYMPGYIGVCVDWYIEFPFAESVREVIRFKFGWGETLSSKSSAP